MDWQDRMNRAIAWIEANLTEEIAWDTVAREAACSTFHFLRMFEVITSLTPGEYVRRRRLSRAAMELAAGDARIIDLALRYGYDSPDAFAKAFRKLFGCTPTDARRPGARLRSYPPISFSITLRGDEAMNYRIETKSSFSLTGLPLHTTTRDGANSHEITAFWDRCFQDGSFARLASLVPGNSAIGVAGVIAEFDAKGEDFTYLIAIETPADRSALPEGSRDLPVPAATWAVFESRGPLPGSIQNTFMRIFSEWFPSSSWEHAEGPELEIYSQGDTHDPNYYSEVWIPVKKAAN